MHCRNGHISHKALQDAFSGIFPGLSCVLFYFFSWPERFLVSGNRNRDGIFHNGASLVSRTKINVPSSIIQSAQLPTLMQSHSGGDSVRSRW